MDTKGDGTNVRLLEYYLANFGNQKTKAFKVAQQAFCLSLAAYSLVCYILQIKDRHNGNILIDQQGHIIHIDFGFVLSNAPGKGLKFEKAPFKLTQDFVDILGGSKSKKFNHYRKLMKL